MDRLSGAGGPLPEGGHVVIIGAGIVGVATAIWLSRAGRRVTLIDRAGPGEGASGGNGGVLASASIVPVTVPGLLAKAPRMLFDPDQPLFLRWSYLPRLAPWLWRYLAEARADRTRATARALAAIIGDSLAQHQALAAGTAAAARVVPCDYSYLYRDRAHFDGDAFGWGLRRDAGFRWDELEGAALRNYDPAWGPQIGFAARLGGHGRIDDPGAYLRDLAAHAEGLGARLVRAEAQAVVIEAGRVTGLRIATPGGQGGEVIACDALVLCAGAWSGVLARQLGLQVPLETERGYHLDLFGASIMPKAAAMVAAGKFVATPMTDRLRLAGIVEFGGLTAGPSRPPFALLLKNIRAAMPGLTWDHAEEWMGHRPAPADSVPVIGALPGAAGAYAGFGHHHVGLTGGPRTGRILADLICGRAPNLDLAPYAASRFH